MLIKSFTFKLLITKFLDYFKFLLNEYLVFINYFNALIIGFVVNSLAVHRFPGSPAPYIIPLIVQTISKSVVKYKNRHMERLVQLPSEREDPVFIMKENGDIILSTGMTYEKFEEHNITNISGIIGTDGLEYLSYSFFDDEKGNRQTRQAEVYSKLFNRWYEVKIKCIYSKFSRFNKEYLIWFTDITELRKQTKRMSNMLAFSNDIITSLPILLEKYIKDEILPLLSKFIFSKGYYAVFIAMQDHEDDPRGIIIKKNEDEIIKSSIMTFNKEVLIFKADCDKSEFICEDIKDYESREDFEQAFSFDGRITEFLSDPVCNYILYRLSNVFMIAFNKNEEALDKDSSSDKELIEIITRDLQTFLDLKEYVSSYFLHYLKALNEEF